MEKGWHMPMEKGWQMPRDKPVTALANTAPPVGVAAAYGDLTHPAGTAFLLKQDSTNHCKCVPWACLTIPINRKDASDSKD